MHYERMQRGMPVGDAAPRQVSGKTIEDRYWAKVNDMGGWPTECWSWTAGTSPGGYGAFWDGTYLPSGGPRMVNAHRWAAIHIHHWVIPSPEVFICHTCDNRLCQNPAHWFLGTTQENTADRTAKGRELRGEANPRSKLTAAQVADIRASLRDGARPRGLADQFGVTYANIIAIKNGLTWRGVQASGSS